MAGQLSFADRENLLVTIRKLGDKEVDLDSVLKKTGDWARALDPQFGFEHALLRNATHLANYLRLHHATEDIASIARGALLFVVTDNGRQVGEPDKFDEETHKANGFHALSQAFLASYTVHEIAARLGEPVAYHPPAIAVEEQARAEDLFEKLSQQSGCDLKLIEQVEQNVDEIRHLADCGFLKRLVSNAQTLVGFLKDDEHSEEHKTWARGALRYFVEDDDAISDELGLVGYLDDLFILQTAVDCVTPAREPLLELLDEVVGVWPFLNMFALDDGSGPRAASEFTIISSALSCRDLRDANALNTMLIAPETGPLAILLGFISTLGLAHEAGRRLLTEESFVPGQKVLIDYEAVAEFDGFEDVNGRRLFWLKKYNTTRGVVTRSRTSWPITDLHRLVPVDQHRVVRGEINRGKRNEITELSGLSFLFNGPNKADVHAIKKKVVVVMPTTLASDFCKSTSLYGQPLKDVLPVGQVSPDGEEAQLWSSRFGTQPPVLLFASDLDIACSFAQENRADIELMVIDASGRNREKHASIKLLNRLKIPCLMVATERTANETESDQHNDLSVWEWGAEDLKSLVWPEMDLGSGAGEIAKFEHRIRATSSARPMVEAIAFPIMSEAFSAFSAIRRLAKKRAEEGPPELEEIVAQGFYAITQLMRCATPLAAESNSVKVVRKRIAKICSLSDSSNFLSSDEEAAAKNLVSVMRELVSRLKESNPKHQMLVDALAKRPTADILCLDARLLTELEAFIAGQPNRVLASASAGETFDNGLVVPGWFKQSRMAAILSPPIADPLILLLYDIERKWHCQFAEQRQKAREERARLRGREAIFPSLKGWNQPDPATETIAISDPEIDNIEDVRVEVDEGLRSRIYNQVGAGHSDADTKARLLLFAGGVYGLFTDNYKLNVVTHLLDNLVQEDDKKASVKLSTAKGVEVGDKIVFGTKSRDLIREVADDLLKPGERELSGLWKAALLAFKNKHSLSDDALCRKLQSAGCSGQAHAICNWISDAQMIAPQQYRKDIPIIARVTGCPELSDKIEAVIAAVKKVRGAHQQKAPRVIAKRIREKAATAIRQEQADEPVVELGEGLVLLRVLEPASKPIPVRYAAANRLIEDDSWHE